MTRHCDDYDDYEGEFIFDDENDELLDKDFKEDDEQESEKEEHDPFFDSWGMAFVVGPLFGDDL